MALTMDNKNFETEPKTMTQGRDAILELTATLNEGKIDEAMLGAAIETIAATIRGWKYTEGLDLREEHRIAYAANEGAKVALRHVGLKEAAQIEP